MEVARDLIPSWNVEHGLEADRGGLPIAVAAGISLAVGLLIWLLYPRRRTASPPPPPLPNAQKGPFSA